MNVDITLTEKQAEYATSEADEVLLSGAWGAGKSFPLCAVLYLRALHPGAREGLFRRTLQKLYETTLVTLLQGDGQTPPVIPPGSYTQNQQRRTITIHGGGTIFYGPAETMEDVKAHNLTGAHVDEADDLREEIWEGLGARCRVKVPGLIPQLRGACNPNVPAHFLAVRFGIRRNTVVPELAFKGSPDQPIRCHAIMTKTFDNPYLPAEARARYASYTGITRLRFVEGEWVGSEGMIYDNFNRDLHVQVREGPWERRLIGVDDGTTAPACILGAGIDADGRIHIFSETQRAGMHLSEKLEAVEAAMPAEAVVVDPAASGLKLELRDAGYAVVDANNDVEPGIQATREAFNPNHDGLPGITIDPSCTKLVQQIETYERNPKTQRETPIKKNDHGCLVGTTTIDTPTGPRLIATIHKGDTVTTRHGPRRVAAAACTDPLAKTMTVLHEHGSIRGTPDHPIWTENRGWVRIDDLRYTDTLLTCTAKPPPGTDAPTTDTQVQKTGAPAGTSAGEHAARKPRSTCTTRSGTSTSVRSPKATTSTTATTTKQTTVSKTSSASRGTSTKKSTEHRSEGDARPSSEQASPRPESWPQNGTDPRTAAGGTARTPKAGKHRVKSGYALTAADPGWPPSEVCTARTTAATWPGSRAAPTTSVEPAMDAATPSQSTSTPRPDFAPSRVLNVTADPGRRPVYNLEVEDDHEYIANGIVVHNCDALRYLVMHIHQPPALAFDTSGIAAAEAKAHAAGEPTFTGTLTHRYPAGREQDLSIAAPRPDDIGLQDSPTGPLKLWCEAWGEPPKPDIHDPHCLFVAAGDGQGGSPGIIAVANCTTRALAAQWLKPCPPERLARVAAMLAWWFQQGDQPAAVQYLAGGLSTPGLVFGQHLARLHVGGIEWDPTPNEFAEAVGLLRAAWEGGQFGERDPAVFAAARQYVYANQTVMHASLAGNPERRSSHSDLLICRAGLWRMLAEMPRPGPKEREAPPGSVQWYLEEKRRNQKAAENQISYG